MHLAVALSLIAVTLNLTTAAAQFAISRAPGWRAARTFGIVALTATFYSLGNLIFSTGGWSDAVYIAASRWNYVWANLHVLAWFPFAFGGPDAELGRVPRGLRLLMLAALVATAVFAVTGWHMQPGLILVPVPWAGVTYHYTVATPAGEWYAMSMVALLTVPFVQLVRRMWAGERSLGLVVAGFAVFYATAVIEVMVANGDLVWLSPADLGFLAVVLPTSVRMLRRFIADAQRLHEWTGRLEGEVRDRTQERDRAESALLEAERLAALGRLAAGVGHEINNPLTYLQLSLTRIDDHLASSESPREVREAIANASDGAVRIQKVVEGLRTYSRREEVLTALDPREAVRVALRVAGPQLRPIARVEPQLAATPAVLADESRLVQAVVNLLVNAAQALDEGAGGGRILVRTRTLSADEIAIEVEDDGPGIPQEVRPRLMEPYFTTRSSAGGSGLGLFVTHGIMAAHGGRLEFEEVRPHGACARLVLRRFTGDPAGTEAKNGAGHPAVLVDSAKPSKPGRSDAVGRRPHVLLVDDEPLVLAVLARALEPRWSVTCAEDGERALGMLATGGYDLVVCDLMMPGLTGMALAARLEVSHPELRRRMVFLTGGAVTDEAQAFLARPGVVHLMKPLDLADLDATLREVVARD